MLIPLTLSMSGSAVWRRFLVDVQPAASTSRMALQARPAGIDISRDFLVFFVHLSFIMSMAVDTGEFVEIRSIRMAIGAGVPGSCVVTGIDGEVLLVVVEIR